MKSWTILLAIITFSLSLMGTFLVRSGVLTSVHSFATDPARGVFILALLVVVIGGSLVLYAVRAPSLKSGALFAPVSREGALLFSNVFLSTAAGTVLLGTLYPLFPDVLDLGKVSVGPPFFNTTFVPLMIPLCLAMPVGALLAWKRGNIKKALHQLRPAMLAAAVTVILVAVVTSGAAHYLWAAAGFGMAAWILAGMAMGVAEQTHLFRESFKSSLHRALKLPLSFYGMTIAHVGMAFLIIGIIGASLWRVEKIQVMHPGETVTVSGYDVTLKKVEKELKGPNYTFTRGTFDVSSGGQPVTVMHPEKRLYEMPPQPTTQAAIRTTLLGDLYVVLADADDKGGYITRVYYDPLVIWIFIGAAFFAGGGMVSVLDRHRLGTPERRKKA